MNDNTIEITLSDGTVARWGLDDQTAISSAVIPERPEILYDFIAIIAAYFYNNLAAQELFFKVNHFY